MMRAIASVITGFGILIASAIASFAAQPVDKGLWHQPAGSDMMASIEWFDAYTLWFIVPITLFVMLLLVIVMIKFNAKANPNPSKTSHNTFIEVVWTVVPIVVLIAIAVPSFELLDNQFDSGEEPKLTIKATAVSWAWNYEYQDDSEISVDSYLIEQAAHAVTQKDPEAYADAEAAIKATREELGKTDLSQYPRLLTVDNELVVPVNEMIRVLVTSEPDGVIHNFAMPAFGLKMDAIPGRTNETWFKANEEGLYYGQCSELCGKFHAYMPIAIRVVSKEQFETWQFEATSSLDNANKNLIASIEAQKNIKLAENAQSAQ
jgi:cytochrome c oxidase subunit 2